MLNKIHLIHHTHYDIGFTDQPEEVIRHQLHFLDQALRLCENNPAYKWTIESGMLLREWMKSRSCELQERMIRQLQAGRMTVGALDMQLLTEVATFPELVESIRRTTEMGRKYGFPVDTAILDDVGGLAGELPAAMEACGVPYLILGTGSCQTELPWANLPYLFYLRSKSGSRILVWNLGCDRNESSSESKVPYAGYSEAAIYLGYNSFAEELKEFDLGVELKLKHPETGEIMDAGTIYSLLADRLERNGYPYDELLIQYGGDNRQ
ncbi:MAG: hypothetical protein J6S21_00925, partial [Victivallales bacterium]|nr:hypothetical protein [Victivallales bacterium]